MQKSISIKNSAGFTMLEILVAFFIAALSLGVIFQVYAKGTKATILGKEYAQAIIIAESRLAKFSLHEQLTASAESGRENDKFDWEVSVDDYVDGTTTDFTPAILLKRLEVMVTWDSSGKSHSINLQTLKPVPAT